MKILIQRVKSARILVNGHVVSGITKGLLLFVGIAKNDTDEDIIRLSRKTLNLRIFEDEQGKMNLNIKQAGGSILSVSQFTLNADTKRGNRPGFEQSASPDMAKNHWLKLNNLLRNEGIEIREGVFAAHMEVELINDGPVTIMLD
jgi:D-tyrosyl-tRNA(Tyr) deacylase